MEKTDRLEFSDSGWLHNDIPSDCVAACYHNGQCYPDVDYWVERLDLENTIEPLADVARDYLREYGEWDDLETCAIRTLAERVLWVACGDISEQGDWLGMVY